MNARNIAAAVLTLISVGVFIPGLTQPLLTIRATMSFMGQTHVKSMLKIHLAIKTTAQTQ